jgi:7-carboxy-7-deazaguanine synthase
MQDHTLRITEIFHSLQGETNTVGLPTVFVRLTGCPLRCVYCDTAYAFQGGETLSLDTVLEKVRAFDCDRVTVTGGEPLAQKNCLLLLSTLCDEGYKVSLETGGAISLEGVDQRVVKVVDWKTPGSGEEGRNLYDNTDYLLPADQMKFVICDRNDYDWVRQKMKEHRLADRVAEVLLSPCYGELEPATLAEWMLADRLEARLQLQLHKLLWGDKPGH